MTPLLLRLILLLAVLVTPVGASGQGADEELLGTWTGRSSNVRGQVLVLEEGGKGSLAGQKLSWRVSSKGKITYSVAGESATLAYRLQGSTLSFVEEGETSRFRRTGEKKKKDEPEEQEPGKEVRGPGEPLASSGPLEGVDDGAATRHEHPRGWYSFDLPVGWEIAEQNDDGLLINPGLTTTLDAILLVTHGELDEAETNAEVTRLLDQHAPELLAELAGQGIRLDKARKPSRKVTVGEVPGAVQRWTGKTGDGKPVTLWVGGVTKREYWLGVSLIVLGAEEDTFLPGAKRLFSTLELAPPERNRKLEQALFGRSFAHTDNSSSGSFSTTYELRGDLTVFKQSFFSAGEISSSTEDTGRWEIVGDEIYLYFQDGQKGGRLVLQGGQATAVMFGDTRYSFH